MTLTQFFVTWQLEICCLQVILNGSKLPVKTFQDYANLYLGPGTQRVYEKLGDRWEVCISLAEQGQFQQVFVLDTVYALPLRMCMLLSFRRPSWPLTIISQSNDLCCCCR